MEARVEDAKYMEQIRASANIAIFLNIIETRRPARKKLVNVQKTNGQTEQMISHVKVINVCPSAGFILLIIIQSAPPSFLNVTIIPLERKIDGWRST